MYLIYFSNTIRPYLIYKCKISQIYSSKIWILKISYIKYFKYPLTTNMTCLSFYLPTKLKPNLKFTQAISLTIKKTLEKEKLTLKSIRDKLLSKLYSSKINTKNYLRI